MELFNTSDNNMGDKPLKGISCNVKNCAYNDGKNHCTANHIAVGPGYASSCTDTVCATFKSN